MMLFDGLRMTDSVTGEFWDLLEVPRRFKPTDWYRAEAIYMGVEHVVVKLTDEEATQFHHRIVSQKTPSPNGNSHTHTGHHRHDSILQKPSTKPYH